MGTLSFVVFNTENAHGNNNEQQISNTRAQHSWNEFEEETSFRILEETKERTEHLSLELIKKFVKEREIRVME